MNCATVDERLCAAGKTTNESQGGGLLPKGNEPRPWDFCMSNPWFKFYGGEYLADPKTRNLTAEQHSCWLHLLCFAANSTTPGIVEHLTETQLMMYAGVTSPRHTLYIFRAFQERGMIRMDSNKIYIINWKKRQETLLTGAERTKRWRIKINKKSQMKQKSDANVTVDKNRREEIRRDKI